MIKVTNSKGRVLLEVLRAHDVRGDVPEAQVFYSYRGPGIGGYGPRSQVERTIAAIKIDSPSAKVEGAWPEKKER